MNEVKIYQGNNFSVTYDVSISGLNDLSSYTPKLTVKATLKGSALIEKDGSISSLTITIDGSYGDSNIDAGDYMYDIVIDNSIYRYTAVQESFKILDSVKY